MFSQAVSQGAHLNTDMSVGQLRVRVQRQPYEEVTQYPVMEHIETSAIRAGGGASIDVYRMQTQRSTLGWVKAIVVQEVRGDAEVHFSEDTTPQKSCRQLGH